MERSGLRREDLVFKVW